MSRHSACSRRILGISYVLPPLGASIQPFTSRPSDLRTSTSFFPYFLPCWISLRLCPISICVVWRFSGILHRLIPSVTLPPACQISWAGDCQNIQVVGGICRQQRGPSFLLQEPARSLWRCRTSGSARISRSFPRHAQ